MQMEIEKTKPPAREFEVNLEMQGQTGRSLKVKRKIILTATKE